MMSLLRIFHVSGSAVSAQSQRLNTVSSNLANADTAAGRGGEVEHPLRRARLSAIPHAQLTVLPGSHHLHMDQAQRVGDWLGDFFVAQ